MMRKRTETAPLQPAARRRIEKAMNELEKIAAVMILASSSLGELLHPSPKPTHYAGPLTPELRRRNAKLVDEFFAITRARARPLPKR